MILADKEINVNSLFSNYFLHNIPLSLLIILSIIHTPFTLSLSKFIILLFSFFFRRENVDFYMLMYTCFLLYFTCGIITDI